MLPGEGWDKAMEALKKNDAETAELMVPEMLRSDRNIMCSRIVACWFRRVINSDANGNAIK